jgi:hypothetical protein
VGLPVVIVTETLVTGYVLRLRFWTGANATCKPGKSTVDWTPGIVAVYRKHLRCMFLGFGRSLSAVKQSSLFSVYRSRSSKMKGSKPKTAESKPCQELCEYHLSTDSSGKVVRYVKPYFQDFKTHAKGRWIGREILEVFCREFGAHPPVYWQNALRNGQVRINKSIVSSNYKFKNADALLHRTHRYVYISQNL